MENKTYIDKNAYSEFVKNLGKNSLRVIRVCYSIILFCASILLLVFILDKDSTALVQSIVFYVIAAIFILYDIFYVKMNIVLTKGKFINLLYNYNFNDEMLSVKIEKDGKLLSEEKFVYNVITNIVFNNNFAYLFINKFSAYVVDLNAFKNEEDKGKFLEIINIYKIELKRNKSKKNS